MIKHKTTIYCDIDGCLANQTIINEKTISQFLDLGWHISIARDLCPRHAEEQ